MDGNQKIYLKNVYVKQIITSVTLYPTAIYIFKTNNRNTRMSCEICSNLTIKTPERLKCRRSGVFIVEFELISHLFLLLTLSRWTGGFITLRSNEVVDKLVTFFQGYAKMLAKKKVLIQHQPAMIISRLISVVMDLTMERIFVDARIF